MSLVASDFAFKAEGRDYVGRLFADSDWGPEKKFPGVLILPSAAPDKAMEKMARRLGDLKFAAILLSEPLPAGPIGSNAFKRAMFFAQMRDEVRTDEICALGFGSGADIAIRAAAESRLLAAAVVVGPDPVQAAGFAAALAVPSLLILPPGVSVPGLKEGMAAAQVVEGAEPGAAGHEQFFALALAHLRKHTYEKPVVEKPYISAVTDYMGM